MDCTRYTFWHESWKLKIIQRPKSDRNQLPRCQPYPFRTKVNRARVVPRCWSAQMESLYTWVSSGTYLAEKIHGTILILYTLCSVQATYFPSHISPPCLFEGPCRCTSYIPRTAWLYADLSGIQGTNIRELVSFCRNVACAIGIPTMLWCSLGGLAMLNSKHLVNPGLGVVAGWSTYWNLGQAVDREGLDESRSSPSLPLDIPKYL